MNREHRDLFLDGLIQVFICDTKFIHKFGKQPFLDFCSIYWKDT